MIFAIAFLLYLVYLLYLLKLFNKMRIRPTEKRERTEKVTFRMSTGTLTAHVPMSLFREGFRCSSVTDKDGKLIGIPTVTGLDDGIGLRIVWVEREEPK
jgi:hypothetical protein